MMKKMLVLVLGAVALSLANGCFYSQKSCVCGTENCTCDCDPCRMGWTHVRCFETYNKDKAVVEEVKVTENSDNLSNVVKEAIEETKIEAQKSHLKIIPSYVEFALDYDSLAGVKELKEKPEKAITMTFAEKDGKIIVAGCSGVNRYFGNAVITKESNEIKFSQMGSTMMMGPGMEVEKLFLQNLEKVAKYGVNESKLSFMNANGEILAVFTLKK